MGLFLGNRAVRLYAMWRDPDSLKKGYSANSYLRVLEDNLLGIWEPGLVFMQDNAPIHKARKITEWMQEQGIEIMEWPPYSPDMNPIEHLWFRLKELVYEVNPDIEKVGGNVDKVQEALFETLAKAWQLIEKDYMHDLIWSMQASVKALIETEGWYTRY